MGSSVAWRGGNAARYWATVSGVTGKRPRKSELCSADTMGPVLRSRQTATGWPLHRVRRLWPQASMTSGRCARCRNSRCAEPAACQQISCVASAQSRPTKAANASGACGCMCDRPGCGTVVRRHRPACVLRRHDREPVVRQTLRMRCRPPAPLRSRGDVRKHHVLARAGSYSAGACACFP